MIFLIYSTFEIVFNKTLTVADKFIFVLRTSIDPAISL